MIPRVGKAEKTFRQHFITYNRELGELCESVGEMKGTLNAIHERIQNLPCKEHSDKLEKISIQLSSDNAIKKVTSRYKWQIISIFSGIFGAVIIYILKA